MSVQGKTSTLKTFAPNPPAKAAPAAAPSAVVAGARPAVSTASQFRAGGPKPFQPPRDPAAARPAAPRDPKLQLLATAAELKANLPGGAAAKLPAEKMFDSRFFQELSPDVQKQAIGLMQSNLAAGPKSQDRVLQIIGQLDAVRTDAGKQQVLSGLQQCSPLGGAPQRDETFHAALALLRSPEFAALPADKQHRVTGQIQSTRAEPGQTRGLLDQIRNPNF